MYPKPTFESRWIILGCHGCQGILQDTNLVDEGQNREFEFEPTSYMRWKHQIGDEELDRERLTLTKKFPADLCVPLDLSPSHLCWVVLCDYDGSEETDIIKKFNKSILIEKRSAIQENKALRALLLRNLFMQKKQATYKGEEWREFKDKAEEILRLGKKEKEEEKETEQAE